MEIKLLLRWLRLLWALGVIRKWLAFSVVIAMINAFILASTFWEWFTFYSLTTTVVLFALVLPALQKFKAMSDKFKSYRL